MKILAVVVTFNGEIWINKCIDSLINSSIPVDIVCIDNNSSDSTCSILKNNYPSVKLIESKNNLGFGKANNIGFKNALEDNYDYVFLLNQDARIENSTIEKLVQVATQNSDYGLISPIHLNEEGSGLDLKFSEYIRELNCKDLFSDLLLKNPQKDVYPLTFVNAASWLIPKNTLLKIGGFDPIFFHYGEDDNYCQRLNFHEFKIGVVPSSKIYHDRKQIIDVFDKYDSLINFERILKVSCANINYPFEKLIRKEFKELQRKLIISFVCLRFFSFKKWLKFYFFLLSALPKLKNSRALNQEIGIKYFQ